MKLFLFGQLANPLYIVQIFIVLASLVIHEFSHAFMADLLGDKTARLSGRLTLNPVAHLQLLGLIMILFAPIGWAKPVPVDMRNFKNPRFGLILTAAAGPISNLLLACLCFIILRIAPQIDFNLIGHILFIGALVNVSLFLFNLIPLPPLDGSQIVRNLLPYKQAIAYSKLDIYGPFILLLIFIIPQFGQLLFIPALESVTSFVASFFGV